MVDGRRETEGRRWEKGDGRQEMGERGRGRWDNEEVEGRRMNKGREDKIQIRERGDGSQDKKQKRGNLNRIREMRTGDGRRKKEERKRR
jgi:hypothetical protein